MSEKNENDILNWYSSEFLLKLREEGMISHTALSKAAEGVDDLFHSYTQAIKSLHLWRFKYCRHMVLVYSYTHIANDILDFKHYKDRIIQGVEKDGRVSKETIENVLKEFGDGIFVDAASKSSLEDFCKEHGEILTPEPVVLREEKVFSEDDDSEVKNVLHRAYICPFLPSLKRLLKRPDVLECVDNPMDVSDDEVIRSYRDGKYCKEHKILSLPGSLAVIFTFDELEVSSPLGPKKHKMGLYYWTLANQGSDNLPNPVANFYPTMRSSLKSVQLYTIVMSLDLKGEAPVNKRRSVDSKFESHSKIMAPFIEDIKKLEKGIKVEIKSSMERDFQGSLYCVTGDAPAVSVFCGCKESVGPAKKPCHLCLVNNDEENNEMKVIFNEDMFQIRTLALRTQHFESVHVSQLVKDRQENSTLCGVNGPSVIEGLESFHQVQAFVFDLMHILHEGVIVAHLQMLLQHAVSNNYFTIDEINKGVSRVAKQILVTDKPANIKIEHLQTDELGERLENFIRLVKISMGLLAYEVSSAELLELKRLIRQHNETFTVHYPSFDMTPKFHFLVHLPSQIEQFGPSRVTWTMRFEAMHSYFKDLMRIMKNFINPPYSCSYRYECLRTAQMLIKPNGKKNLTVVSCSSLKTNGVTYSRKSVILVDANKPVFAEIRDIVIYGEIHILLVTNLKTVKYEPLCNAFVVQHQNPEAVSPYFVENLLFFNTLPSPMINGVQYVIPKYHRLGFMPLHVH
ncbi:5-oxoprolinase subunit A [Frankliniella fusca]|uniref:5-oxoprolinase subunit A n=1 Tax=Frankliniella fusca TaxID=407009 RepID=A0AAE1HCT1_9NEOP|nr:5-oxoprolinase subunit A [Frankliniella fusca]